MYEFLTRWLFWYPNNILLYVIILTININKLYVYYLNTAAAASYVLELIILNKKKFI
jgi:hypothetical protein